MNKILDQSSLHNMNKDITRAIHVFKDGGVVVFPTDTVFGIGCRMDDDKAVARVFDIKNRSLDNAVLVLVDSIEMAEKYVEVPDEVSRKLVAKHWPGGLSIFFKTKPGKVPSIVTAGTDILAVRYPDHPEIIQVIREVGVPIVATSANRSGQKTPYKLGGLDEGMVEQVDFVLPGACTYEEESTIIDTTVNPWKVIREGAVKIDL